MVTEQYNVNNFDDDSFNSIDRTEQNLTKFEDSDLLEGNDALNQLKTVPKAFVQGAAGVPDLALGLSEVAFNALDRITDPFSDLEDEPKKYKRFPRIVPEEERARTIEEGGIPAQAAMFAGGFAGGMGLGQIQAVRNLLFAAPVETAVTNLAGRFFSNPQLGQSLLGQGLQAAGRVGGYGVGAGTANMIGDAGYNLAESTDDEGNIDFNEFAKREADSGLYGLVFGGGLSVTDPIVRKEVKGFVTNLTKTANNRAKFAVEMNSQRIKEAADFEQNKKVQAEQEEAEYLETIKEPEPEAKLITEVVDPETVDDTFARNYKQESNKSIEEDAIETNVDTTNPKEVEDALKEKSKIKETWQNMVTPSRIRLQDLSDDGYLAARQDARSKVKRATYKAAVKPFAEAFLKSFKESPVDKALKVVGKKTKRNQFKDFVSNEDFDGARNLLAAESNADDLLDGFETVINTYKQIGNEAVEIGLMKPENMIENYWSRHVKDPEAFVKKGEKQIKTAEDISQYKKLINQQMAALDRPLTPRERAHVLQKYLNSEGRIGSIPKNLRKRTVKQLNDLNRDAYADELETLNMYINDTVDKIEQYRYLTMKDPAFDPRSQKNAKKLKNRIVKLAKENPEIPVEQLETQAVRQMYAENRIKDTSKVITDEDIKLGIEQEAASDPTFLEMDKGMQEQVVRRMLERENRAAASASYDGFDDKIKLKTDYLVKTGKLAAEDRKEYMGLLKAVYANGKLARGPVSRFLSNIGYNALLGNVYSASTQLKDGGVPMSRYGVKNVLKGYMKGVFNQADIKLSDIGLDDLIDELFDARTGASPMSLIMKPLGYVDQLGKTASIDAAYKKYRKFASEEKGIEKIRKKYDKTYTPEEIDQLVNALKNNDKDHWTVRDLMVHELSDFQPVSLLDRPQFYLDNPHLRLLYDLKTFMLKRQSFIYDRLVKNATKNNDYLPLVSFMTLVPLVNASVDLAQDKARGKEVKAMDSLLDATLDSAALNRYNFSTARKGSQFLTDIAINQVPVLPTPLFSMASTVGFDIANILSGQSRFSDLQSLRFTPFVGPFANQMVEGLEGSGRGMPSRKLPRRNLPRRSINRRSLPSR